MIYKYIYILKNNKIMKKILSILSIFFLTSLFSCQKDEIVESKTPTQNVTLRTAATFPETFESGTKSSYTAGNVSLGSGSWYFNNAMIGTTTSDRKTGSKSARIQSAGSIEMNFNNYFAVNFVTIQHAKYGTTSNSTWQLFYSTDNGTSWIQSGTTITTSSTTLASSTFTLNLSVPARFKIVKLSGTGILNIDNFLIDEQGEAPSRDDNMALGNPSNSTTSISNPNNYLLVKTQYCLSYNNSKGGANWVSWHMSNAWKGAAARCDCFTSDTQIPSTLFRAGSTSFSESGFDRGHMCPSEDRDGSSTDNAATFLMSNMIPQAPNNNQITWNSFEGYCRDLLNQGNELYIISGGYGSGGTGSNGGITYSISNGQINVPSNIWKVVLVLPIGSNDVSRVSASTRIIAVNVPNNQTVNSQPWKYYRTSVDQIEALTGFDFFSNVSPTIQSSMESVTDATIIP